MKLDFIEGLKEGKKMSPRDVQMIFVVVGLIIFVAVYFLVFNNYTKKNEQLDAKLTEREAYLNELKGYEGNLLTYRKTVDAAKKNIALNMSRLPVGLEDEDFLIWLIRADEAIGSDTNSVNFNSVDKPQEFSTYVGSQFKKVRGYRASVTASMTLNYQQFKKYLDYIYDPTQNYTFIDSVAVTYNSESADLSTIFNLSKYFIEYDGGAYVGEKGFNVPLGNPDPFRSK